MKKHHCALVLGGYVNGYCIIRGLYEEGVTEIILFDYDKRLAAYSNKIRKFTRIRKDSQSLLGEIEKLHDTYDHIVLFPTDDLQIELLSEIHDQIKNYCFVPFNHKNIIECSDKYQQYRYSEKLDVPYPRTVMINTSKKIKDVERLPFPVLIKPTTRVDQKGKMFRSLELKTRCDYSRNVELLERVVDEGVSLIASETVPGDGSNIYAYVGYRNYTGEILNEWVGKKLSQFPNDFGIFSSASNQAPEVVREQGRKLLHGMDLVGINEPEFKYDYRDGQYKLMEINLRSMMWHRVGSISGVNLQYAQYLDAMGKEVPKQRQTLNKVLHLVYVKHEIMNLARRRGYLKWFLRNLFTADKTHFAIFEARDLKPFLIDCTDLVSRCLNDA